MASCSGALRSHTLTHSKRWRRLQAVMLTRSIGLEREAPKAIVGLRKRLHCSAERAQPRPIIIELLAARRERPQAPTCGHSQTSSHLRDEELRSFPTFCLIS